MSGQLLNPTALPPWNDLPLHSGYMAAWVPEQIWTQPYREGDFEIKNFAPFQNLTLVVQSVT
jgi:hypothetical protein